MTYPGLSCLRCPSLSLRIIFSQHTYLLLAIQYCIPQLMPCMLPHAVNGKEEVQLIDRPGHPESVAAGQCHGKASPVVSSCNAANGQWGVLI